MKNLEKLELKKFKLDPNSLSEIHGGAPFWVKEGKHRFLWRTWTTSIDINLNTGEESVCRSSDPKCTDC